MAEIRKVWRKGLELPWPLDSDDLAKGSGYVIVPAPNRRDVEPWVKAARNDTDLYERSWFLVEINHGLRPMNKQAALKRRHIRFGEATGKALGIVAGGSEAGFKTESYVVAAFAAEEADALAAWLSVHPDASQDAYCVAMAESERRRPNRHAEAHRENLRSDAAPVCQALETPVALIQSDAQVRQDRLERCRYEGAEQEPLAGS